MTLVPDSADVYLWGGESIIVAGVSIGEVSSAGWSPRAGACVALGYVRGDSANAPHTGTAAQVGLWGESVAVKLYDRWPETAA